MGDKSKIQMLTNLLFQKNQEIEEMKAELHWASEMWNLWETRARVAQSDLEREKRKGATDEPTA